MTVQLRYYQQDMVNDIHQQWNSGFKNVCGTLSTGGGKSIIVSNIISQEQHGVCVIAHRTELVSQMSMHLSRDGIHHNIIAPVKLIQMICKMQMMEFKKVWYNPQSKVAVAGVQTIIRRGEQLKRFLPSVRLWIIDEQHHLVQGNSWGKAVEMFTHPEIRGLGVTATPLRSDKKGLGRHADGYMDRLVEGPSMRQLINEGHLTDYKIYAPVSNFNADEIKQSQTTGDFVEQSAGKAVAQSSLVVHEKSTKVGDVVEHYIKLVNGKLSVVFVPSMDIGYELEQQFNDVGIAAKLINAKTPDIERSETIKQFERGEYKVLLNCDIFSEGFDLPAIECVIMARPTQSYGLHCQMFGRALRLMNGKQYGIIIDHVGNVARLGLPDAPRKWTLDAEDERKSKIKPKPLTKVCDNCSAVYSRELRACPYCGYIREPSNRSSIEEVEGDLTELSQEMLAQLRSEIADIDKPIEQQVQEYSAGLNTYIKDIHRMRHEKLHRNKVINNQEAQRQLRETMAQWGGWRRYEGRTDDEIYRKFYVQYDIDWLNAMSLKHDEAIKLKERIEK